jgi:hypothetical protein
MEDMNFTIAFVAISLLLFITISAWIFTMIKVIDKQSIINSLLELSDSNKSREFEEEKAALCIQKLLVLIKDLPLIKIGDSYRVTYDIHNREKAKVRIRYSDGEGKRIRETVEAEIGFGTTENWTSLETISRLHETLCNEPSATKIIKTAYKSIKI